MSRKREKEKEGKKERTTTFASRQCILLRGEIAATSACLRDRGGPASPDAHNESDDSRAGTGYVLVVAGSYYRPRIIAKVTVCELCIDLATEFILLNVYFIFEISVTFFQINSSKN